MNNDSGEIWGCYETPKFKFFTKTGQLIDEKDLHLNTKGFVVLGTIQIEEHFEKMPNLISQEDLKIAKNIFIIKQITTRQTIISVWLVP